MPLAAEDELNDIETEAKEFTRSRPEPGPGKNTRSLSGLQVNRSVDHIRNMAGQNPDQSEDLLKIASTAGCEPRTRSERSVGRALHQAIIMSGGPRWRGQRCWGQRLWRGAPRRVGLRRGGTSTGGGGFWRGDASSGGAIGGWKRNGYASCSILSGRA